MPDHWGAVCYRPVRGDKVRVGLNGVFVETPANVLDLEVGATLRMEIPLPSGDTIRPVVAIIGVDEDFFAADYMELSLRDRGAIDAYYASRPSQHELLVWAVQTEVAAQGTGS